MDPNERRNRAEEEAAEWWLRLQAADMSRLEREQFVDWLRESRIHVAEMLRVASVHGALEQFQDWVRITTSGSEDGTVVSLPGRSDDRPAAAKRRTLAWPIAAALACIALASALLLPNLRSQTIETERGERREVALDDGSVVQVDPESRLRIKFERDTRRVYLDAGRALFRVATNPHRPFLVLADATTVRAVGTAFGVERRDQGLVVTVAEGKVAVEGSAGFVSLPTAEEAQSQSDVSGAGPSAGQMKVRDAQVFLTANEQVTVRPSGSAAEVRKVDSARVLAWADGRLVFESTPIAEVVRQFNRYNRIQLHVDDEQLARRPISGVFNAAQPESFIAFVQSTTAVHVDRTRAGAIVIASDR